MKYSSIFAYKYRRPILASFLLKNICYDITFLLYICFLLFLIYNFVCLFLILSTQTGYMGINLKVAHAHDVRFQRRVHPPSRRWVHRRDTYCDYELQDIHRARYSVSWQSRYIMPSGTLDHAHNFKTGAYIS